MEHDKINFLANPYSPHVRHWEELLRLAGYNICIHTIHSSKKEKLTSSRVERILPLILNHIPTTLKYILAGLFIRIVSVRYPSFFLHAHNTSGYGLTAFLSGKQYIITTYGSEIFQSHNKSKLYYYLIRLILKKATAISSTSPEMTKDLISKFGVDTNRIFEFSLGISNIFCYEQKNKDEIKTHFGTLDGPIWVVNRRIHPHYHTLEVAQAFMQFRKKNKVGTLILLEGDSDYNYLEKVELLCTDNSYIKLIKGFLSQQELVKFLSIADFSISVPESDQLSSSILEAAACGAIPLLADLDSYASLREFSMFFKISDLNNVSCYEQIFTRSYAMLLNEEYKKCQTRMLNKIENFKMDSLVPNVKNLYKFIHKKIDDF
ncbi:glycosyltransferase [Legionella jamestowniensis]|uniref:Glycosyltransferase subfamily 4-like N-terminal domain-containing protein n=1 Tax=Legionella jamestowniensis TaxID=455 RepID=A0A0W0UG26_9GAMM|nr:glycosyltransferase [Legionella jamestowniensis]KTD06819.1 hypothetical protein Ljam_1014 [Legionella jamestowniensis]SFL82723.1 Glycosyltransferase involved in cell wall bisynthesis [Legionella jamestowniensis DSM 19215]